MGFLSPGLYTSKVPPPALSLLQSLSVLLKCLAGGIPWGTYVSLLDHSHQVSKDHTTAIDTAKYIQQLVTGVSLGWASS